MNKFVWLKLSSIILLIEICLKLIIKWIFYILSMLLIFKKGTIKYRLIKLMKFQKDFLKIYFLSVNIKLIILL